MCMRISTLSLTLLILFAACTGNQENQMEASSTPVTTEKIADVEQIRTLTHIPIAEQSALPVSSPTAVETPGHTPTPLQQLCSPLPLHPLEQLPSIIGDPYQPPRPGREERHHGIDFGYYHFQDRDSMVGEPVQSILPGGVASVLNDLYPYGNMVMIETIRKDIPESLIKQLEIPSGKSLYILYAHMDQAPLVSLGDQVQMCQPLGEVGMSGNTDIPHLHVETRLGPSGHVFESMRYYDTRATLEELAAYELWRTSGEFQHFDPMLLLGQDGEEEEISEP